jgi:hypothetical protein
VLYVVAGLALGMTRMRVDGDALVAAAVFDVEVCAHGVLMFVCLLLGTFDRLRRRSWSSSWNWCGLIDGKRCWCGKKVSRRRKYGYIAGVRVSILHLDAGDGVKTLQCPSRRSGMFIASGIVKYNHIKIPLKILEIEIFDVHSHFTHSHYLVVSALGRILITFHGFHTGRV